MSEYNCKNYTAHGGNETVIGGTLTINGTLDIKEGATVTGLFTAAENQADSTATTIADLKADLNTLLAALKTAGLMEADPEPDPEGDPEPDPEGDPEPDGE